MIYRAMQFETLHLAAGSIAAATAGLGGGSVAGPVAALCRDLAGLSTTVTKMALFAGSLDVLGPGADESQAAYRSATA